MPFIGPTKSTVRLDMKDNMILHSMATHHVPILPSPNPAPVDINLDLDMNNNDNDTILDATSGVSSKTTSPTLMSAKPTSVKTQVNVQTTENVTDITSQVSVSTAAQAHSVSVMSTENTSHVPVPTPTGVQTASSKMKIHNATDKSTMEEKNNPESVEETSPASQVSPEDPSGDCTISISAQDATSKARPEEDIAGDTVAGAPHTPPNNEKSTESEIKGSKPAVAKAEVVEAAKAEPNIKNTADSESGLSNNEPGEPMDLDAFGDSDNKGKNAVLEDHDAHAPTAEVPHTRGGSNDEQVVSKNISPADDPTSDPGPSPDAVQSDDTTTQVDKLHAAYDSSGESRASQRKEKKTEDNTVLGAQAEHTAPDDINIMASEPVTDRYSTVTTSESTAEQEEETILPDKPLGSLFGGPAGNQIPSTAEATQAPKFDPVAQTETDNGFEELFRDKMTNVSTRMNSHLQSFAAVGMEFNFEASNTGESAQPNDEEDSEPQAVIGAQRAVSSPSISSDHDAKPVIGVYPSTTSPAPSHATSNNSQESQQTSASYAVELNNMSDSGDLYPYDTDIKDFPPEYFELDQPSSGPQPVQQSIDQSQPCNCESVYHCSHRVVRERNLRPRKEGHVCFSNQIPDTDTSGDYTEDKRFYPSSWEVAREDRDDDEVTIEDGAEDYLTSGGLVSGDTDPMGRFATRIPFNKTDPLIRDKNPFEEESTSEDEPSSKSSKKRKKKAKAIKEVTRQAKRPRVADITDDQSDGPTSHPLSRTPMTIKKTASRIRDVTKKSPVRKPHPLSQAAKPTKKTTSKKKKAPTNPQSTQQSPTIMQIVQRLAKPHTTKLSYPVHFNSKSSCSTCSCPSYVVIGTGSTRNIKIYDFGNGNREISDANEAGKPQPMQPRPEETSLCMACTTKYMKVLMCKTHDVVPLDVEFVFDSSAAFDRAVKKRCTKDELKGWCSLCPAPASYCCDKNCGAKFCDTCAPTLYGEHEGDLTAMLENTEDKITPEYKHGLRADAELLRKGGELQKFLVRMAGVNKNRTG